MHDSPFAAGKPGRILADGRFVKNREVWLDAQQGKGLEILGTFSRRQGEIYMEMTFTNKGAQPLADFAMMFNKNSFALTPAAALVVAPTPLMPGAAAEVTVCHACLSGCSIHIQARVRGGGEGRLSCAPLHSAVSRTEVGFVVVVGGIWCLAIHTVKAAGSNIILSIVSESPMS
jgi:hypothetical protein